MSGAMVLSLACLYLAGSGIAWVGGATWQRDRDLRGIRRQFRWLHDREQDALAELNREQALTASTRRNRP